MRIYLDTEQDSQAYLIFGLGMIGRHILRDLSRGRGEYGAQLPFSWTRDVRDEREERDILGEVGNLCMDARTTRINVLWSAGKGGFALGDGELEEELTAFSTVLKLAEKLQSAAPEACVHFHMLSSAGGLYEGQTNVGPETDPSPRRSYGKLKLMQEKLLEDSELHGLKAIYRPSTVYGFAGAEQRMGLVARLIWDRINNRVTKIHGSLNTIRDYVYVQDIGRFIAINMRHGSGTCLKKHMLVGGKPTTIDEVIRIVEKIHPRKPYLNYTLSDFNSENNSYNRRVAPPHWKATDLETGIRAVYGQVLAMAIHS